MILSFKNKINNKKNPSQRTKSKHKYNSIPIIEQFVSGIENISKTRVYSIKIEALRFHKVLLDQFNPDGESFNISQINDFHIYFYFDFLRKRVENGEINNKTFKNSICLLNYFIRYLKKNNFILVDYTPIFTPSKAPAQKLAKDKPYTIIEFEEYLKKNEFKNSDTYIRESRKFYTFLLNINNQEFDFLNLENNHIYKYLQYLNQQLENKIVAPYTYKTSVLKLNYFLDFLKKNGLNISYEPRINYKETISFPLVFKDFEDYLTNKNYSCIDTHTRIVRYLHKILIKNIIESDQFKYNELTINHIKKIEIFLLKRVQNEEIKNATMYAYLRSLKLFLQFLYIEKIIEFKYSIHEKFIAKGTRSNEYVPVNDSVDLLRIIEANSRNPERDLAIILILIDTGCRPIEISNIRTSDINYTESSIILYSKKSGQRKLKVSETVKEAIRRYVEIREKYNPVVDYLFVTRKGTLLHVNKLRAILYRFNLKAFNSTKPSAKSFRHTYITNALNNDYGLEQVAEIAGHKHLKSTLYYSYRSPKRLNNYAIPHNPVSKFSKEDF